MTLSADPTALLALANGQMVSQFDALLRQAGCRVLTADSLPAARDAILEGDADLLVLDVEWGPASIAALTALARSRPAPCPVAVVVGWWDARALEAAPHADALIYSPPTERQLWSSLQRLTPLLPERPRVA